jgi:hypothetical protein
MRACLVLVAVALLGCGESSTPAPTPPPTATTAPTPPPASSAPPATEVAPAPPPTQAAAPTADALRAADFAAYPAAAMTGERHMPDFDGAQSDFATYRTRLHEGAAAGPNFAGHYAVVEIGCGAGCNDPYLVDLSTGEVVDLMDRFPDGFVRLEHHVDSALLRTTDLISGTEDWRCHTENFVLRDGTLVSIGSADTDGACDDE